MRLTISSISSGQLVHLDVPADISVSDLKALIKEELPQTPSASQYLYHNGRLLSNASYTLEQCNMKEDDMIVVHTSGGSSSSSQSRQQAQPRPQQQQQQSQAMRPRSQIEYDSELIRLQVLGSPALQEELRSSNPTLYEARNDADLFRQEFEHMERVRAEREREKQREIQMLNEDPFNVEAQRKIEELIRQEQVMENLQSALEHNPEAFGRVTMLYIPVEVNGVAVKAFVDSGAQSTIMSPSCAERCGIMRLVDTRYAGIARGVGTARILGRVHAAQIKIGKIFLACSFTVMEGKAVDLLLGLDMLKRHQATLDLRQNRLVIQDEEVEFLGESEIPKGFDTEEEEPTIEGPSGSKVGGRSGAIVEPPQPVIRDIPQPGGSSQQQQQQQQQERTRHPDAVVEQLQGLGFTREQAIAALDATGGDIDMAANLLFN